MKNQAINLLRYPGGKKRLLDFLLQHLPTTNSIKGNFVEPFVGGGAVFFALGPKRALLADLNQELIDLYQGIQQLPKEIWQIYQSFPATKEGYYQIRDSKSFPRELSYRAARTLYLNRTCFKGMWRYDSNGKFNIGYGGQERRNVVQKALLLEVSKRLRKANLTVSDFEKIIDSTKRNDFIFLDPPYKPGKRSLSQAHYVYGKFSYADHKRLADGLERATKRGVRWAMTTSSHRDLLQLFANSDIIRIPKGTSDRLGILTENSGEVLIRNYVN